MGIQQAKGIVLRDKYDPFDYTGRRLMRRRGCKIANMKML